MNARWHASLRRSASLLEPGWPTEYSGGPFTYALPTVALLLYTRPTDDEPRDFPVERIVEALTTREPALEGVIRHGLTDRRHDLDDDSQLSTLVRWLTEYREPLAILGGRPGVALHGKLAGRHLDGRVRVVDRAFTDPPSPRRRLGWWLSFSALTDPVQVKVDADGGVIRQGLVDRSMCTW
ncbi:hypothetical protein ACFVRB_26665 [Streptomyces nojiriensis]|uniref:hypothetical protein n=1 Tax=Streptomyces nojiriensis TaxID=66374 RepID=UPI0036DE8A53